MHAQNWAGILVPDRATDWSQAGVPGGIPVRADICATVAAETFGNGAVDATAGIQNALDTCPAGRVVLLSAGQFLINGHLFVPNQVVLRGAGAAATILQARGSEDAVIRLGRTSTPTQFWEVAITAGATAGSTNITLADASGISAGMYLVISELNDPSYVSMDGDEGPCTWCDGGLHGGARSRGQVVQVTSVNGNSLGITPALYTAYPLSPAANPFRADSYAGVEDLQVYANNTGYDTNILIAACAFCWVKGVEGNYTDGDHVEVYWGFHDEIRDSYFSNAYMHIPGQRDSDVVLANKTTGTLVENNILERLHVGTMIEWGAAGNVISYNYMLSNFDSVARNFVSAGFDAHGAHPQFNLFEGNIAQQYYADSTWGSSSHGTVYRNWLKGTARICQPLLGRAPVGCDAGNAWWSFQAARSVVLDSLARYYNLVGNVIGSAEMQSLLTDSGRPMPQAATIVWPTARQYDGTAYGFSFGYSGPGDPGTDTLDNADPFTTALLYTNYSNITGTTDCVWNGAPATTCTSPLPPSFYLPDKPRWWKPALPYPAIGPDVTGSTGPGNHAANIPAADCYLVTMGGTDGGAGTPLSFNPALCYPEGPSLDVTAANAARAYGAANPSFTGTVENLQPGDNVQVAYVTLAKQASPAGAYSIIPVVTGPDAHKYKIVTHVGTLTVTPVPLTVVAADATRPAGQPNPVLTGTVTGLLNGDVIAASYVTTAVIDSLPGTYAIVPQLSGAALSNYAVTATNGTLTVTTVATPPTPVSVTPSSGVGISSTFSFLVTDPNGYDYIKTIDAAVTSNGVLSSSCTTRYFRAENVLALLDDAGSTWSNALPVGVAGTLSNSRCTIDLGASSTTALGTRFTLSLAITFSADFTGQLRVRASATDINNLSSDWQYLGFWLTSVVSTPPTVVSATPNSGNGMAQTFVFQFSDPNGYAFINRVEAMLSPNGGLNNSCSTLFDAVAGTLSLINDVGNVWGTPRPLWAGGTLENSQCTINVAGSSLSQLGNNLTLSLAISFKPGFSGTQLIRGWAMDNAGLMSGWQALGSWLVAQTTTPPSVGTVTPASGAGPTQAFTFTYSDPVGYAYIKWAETMISPTLTFNNSCSTLYDRAANTLAIRVDNGSVWSAAVPMGQPGTLQNSQCTIDLGASSAVGSGNTLTLNLATTFKPAFVGNKSIFGWVNDLAGLTPGWKTLGAWTAAQPPAVVSVTPSSGSGLAQTFGFLFSHPAGVTSLKTLQTNISPAGGMSGSCSAVYDRPTNTLALLNDAGVAGGAVTLGAAGTLQNSQCTIDVGASSVVASGNNLALNLVTLFNSGLSGLQGVRASATDILNLTSGWQTLGSWVASPLAVAPTVVSATPNSGSGMAQTFVFQYSDPNGYGYIRWAETMLSPNGGLNNSCSTLYERATGMLALRVDDGSVWGTARLVGQPGTLENSQCTIDLGASSVQASGNALVLTLVTTFKPAFSGTQSIRGWTMDNVGLASGWQPLGSWLVAQTTTPPSVGTVTPASGAGVTQVFSFTYSDPAGYGYIKWAETMISSTLTFNTSCSTLYDRAANTLAIRVDNGSVWSATVPMGQPGTLQNSQCTIDVGASSAVGSGNTLTLNLATTFKPAFAGNKSVFGWVNDLAGLTPGWKTLGAWTATTTPPPSPPSVVSGTPNSGSGASQAFSFVYSDPNGFSSITSAQTNFSASGLLPSSCSAVLDRAAGTLALLNDAGVAGGAVTLGTAGTLQNSQCTIDVGASSAVGSGNTLTLNLAISFKAAFAGTVGIRGFAANNAGLNSGWQTLGTWTVTAPPDPPPTADSVTPNAGSGTTQVFSFHYTDADGYTDIKTAEINISPAGAPASSCSALYDRAAHTLALMNDAGTAWSSALAVGVTGTLSNAQCSIDVGSSSAAGSGNSLTLNLAITFTEAFAGTQSLRGHATDTSNNSSGWQTLGTWTVPTPPAAPTVVSVTPGTGSGTTQSFSFQFSHRNGYTDLKTVQTHFSPTGALPSSCTTLYDRAANTLSLLDDAGTTWSAALTLAASGTLSNSQCSIDVAASSASGSGNTLTLNVATSFKPSFAGTQSVRGLATDILDATSGWQTVGTWTVPFVPIATPPTVVSATPNSGSGMAQTFVFQYSDPNGYAYIKWAETMLSPNGGLNNSCSTLYDRAAGTLALRVDDGSVWGTARPLGQPGTLENSQCTIDVGASSVQAGGNTLVLTVATTFKPAFSGTQSIRGWAMDNAARASGWQLLGSWLVGQTTTPPSVGTVTPASGAGMAQTFTFTYSDPVGYAYIKWAETMISPTLTFNNSCSTLYDRAANTLAIRVDNGNSWSAAVPMGQSGTLQNSQCTIDVGASSAVGSGNTLTLNLATTFKPAFVGTRSIFGWVNDLAGLTPGWKTLGAWAVAQPPAVVSVTPSSGSGLAQTFGFLFSHPAGVTSLKTLQTNISPAGGMSGSCSAVYDRPTNTLALLNDAGVAGGAVTLGTAGTLQNSQCTIDTGASSVVASGNNLSLNLVTLFKSSFTGLQGVRASATDILNLTSGWQTLGSWVPSPLAVAPTVVSATPNSGNGMAQTFVFQYSDPNGYAFIKWAETMLSPNGGLNNSCSTLYDRAAGTLALRVDDGSVWGTARPLGQPGTLENSQCTIDVGASSVQAGGNTLVLTVATTFKPAFSGTQSIRGWAMDNAGLASGWQLLGSWLVAQTTTPPSVGTVTPASGAGVTQIFTFTYSDPVGYAYIKWAETMISPTLTFNNSCSTLYDRAANTLAIRVDNGNSWSAAVPMGQPGTLQNSQCTIDVGASSAVGSGNTLTLNLATTFKPAFVGNKSIFGWVNDLAGLTPGWKTLGAWTVPSN